MKKLAFIIISFLMISYSCLEGQGIVSSMGIDSSWGIHQPKYLVGASKQANQLKPLYDSIWFWQDITTWYPDYKDIGFTYDSHGNLTGETEQTYYAFYNIWTNNGLYVYSYNASE